MTAVGVKPSEPVVAKDIRDLQSWTTHEGPALCRRPLLRQLQPIERALDLGNHTGRNSGVAGGRLQLLVSERTRVTLITFLRY